MRLYLAIAVLLALTATPSFGAGPVETNPYAVQGVVMDEHAVSANAAKDKALLYVQQTALVKLGETLGGDAVSLAFARMTTKEVLPLLKSLSIEQESISPGHYEGTFTVRFLPDQLKPLLEKFGVNLPAEQGPPMMIVPVWMDDKGQMQMWGENPWRNAWLALNAAQAQIPIVIPLGDAEDQATLTGADVAANDVVKLEALRRRYDVKTMLLATAQAAPGGGIHVHVVGDSPLGKITIDKIYTADDKVLVDSATVAAQRFQTLITDKFRSDQAKLTAQTGPQQMLVSVPFAGPSDWNALRARILSAPGVVGLDVTSLDAGGAAATLDYNGAVEDLNSAIRAVGLQLLKNGPSWTISPL